jgi:hypothetical protein
MGFLKGLASAIQKAVSSVLSFPKKIMRKVVGKVLGAIPAVLFVLGVIDRMPRGEKTQPGEEQGNELPTPINKPAPQQEAEYEMVDEEPSLSQKQPVLESEAPEEPAQELSRFQRVKNAAADKKDDLVARANLARDSLSGTVNGLRGVQPAANDLSRSTAPVQTTLNSQATNSAPAAGVRQPAARSTAKLG